ncbi:ankyrin repeat domain-containing protein [Luteimonas sp. SMYT11W]|uniref:Ankyrin repeat domain-containing protein n=1 Tax=Luteimonas flava TaxID=3115822 RepID=A0ABU7WI41_9GAMM
MKIGNLLGFPSLSALATTVLLGCSETTPGQPLDASHAQVPACVEGQPAGIAPTASEIAAHRRYDVPLLTIAEPHDPERIWGLTLVLQVDRSGSVTCYRAEDEFGDRQPMTNEHRVLLRGMRTWRFEPFLQEGAPVPAIVREQVYEQRLPHTHRSPPGVPLDQVKISLRRTGCFGSCPAYSVEIQGDGAVTYEGHGWVDVEGVHRYEIPPSQVALLVADITRRNLWSMDSSYRAPVTDNPTHVLTLRMGEHVHRIDDYAGVMIGMPRDIREFQAHVDKVGQVEAWTRLSVAAVDRLQQEGFDFRSPAAGDLLARAVENDAGQDDQAMLLLIEYGAPLQDGTSNGLQTAPAEPSLLDRALENHRLLLVSPLIERGALKTKGALDPHKLDSAFRAAIRGGRLAAVQAIWDQGGHGVQPALLFTEQPDQMTKDVPVTFLLARRYGDEGWEGLRIAQWLAARGVDLKARGASRTTLLHVAVRAGDIEFVRFLLNQKFDVNAPGEFDLPALGTATNEDIALMLLQHGSDWQMDDNGSGFLRYARDQHWNRVLAWLKDRQEPKLPR